MNHCISLHINPWLPPLQFHTKSASLLWPTRLNGTKPLHTAPLCPHATSPLSSIEFLNMLILPCWCICIHGYSWFSFRFDLNMASVETPFMLTFFKVGQETEQWFDFLQWHQSWEMIGVTLKGISESHADESKKDHLVSSLSNISSRVSVLTKLVYLLCQFIMCTSICTYPSPIKLPSLNFQWPLCHFLSSST